MTPGVGDQATATWPADTQIARSTGRPALLIFLHPACPCSRASVQELARLLTHIGLSVDTTAVFVRPEGFSAGWEKTDLWTSAASLSGVVAMVDPAGQEARRFGAATSGYTALYDPAGRLVFRGGITAARGHEGDNSGKTAILEWFEHGRVSGTETPVFGCGLFDE